MRRLLASSIVVVAVLGAGGSVAAPGPNGHNNYGLCKAYFSGSDTGRANKRKAPPFQGLERAAGVDEDDGPEEVNEKVAEFCASATPGGKGDTPRTGADAGKGKGRTR